MKYLKFENEDYSLAVGRYQGESLSDVADEDREYLVNLMERDDITHKEKVAISERIFDVDCSR